MRVPDSVTQNKACLFQMLHYVCGLRNGECALRSQPLHAHTHTQTHASKRVTDQVPMLYYCAVLISVCLAFLDGLAIVPCERGT
jgi:hypothetical protein